MKDMMFFDANARIGNTMHEALPDVAGLIAEMDRNGVDYALVRETAIDTWGAITANREIAKTIASDASGRLTGVWCILPSQCDELPPPDEFLGSMKAARIGALTLFPFDHRYIPCRLTLGKMIDAATERKIPILLHGMAYHWQEIYDFVKEFPNIYGIVNAGNKWGSDRMIRPLLEQYPNIKAELAGYWVPEGIYDMAKKYGAERIVYGSGFPGYNHGNGMLQIRHSGLSQEENALIAGLNMKNMLEAAEL